MEIAYKVVRWLKIWLWLFYLVSVSYTHLDVYKRQVFVLGLRRILHLAFTFKFRFEQEENRRGPRLTEENRDHMTELYLTNTEQVLEALSNLEGVYHSDLLSYLKRCRIREAEIIQSGAFVERVITHLNPCLLYTSRCV